MEEPSSPKPKSPSPDPPAAAGAAAPHAGPHPLDPFDHRAIGNRQRLFHQQEDGPGQVFWHPRGFALYQAVEAHIRRHMRRAGYCEVAPSPGTRAFSAPGWWPMSGLAIRSAAAWAMRWWRRPPKSAFR